MIKNEIELVKTIQNSNLFDPLFYLKEYSDVRVSDLLPLEHYIKFGIEENRKPNKDFDPLWYSSHYSDFDVNIIYPFIHYILKGKKENRLTNPNQLMDKQASNNPQKFTNLENAFDKDFYLKNNPDVKDAKVDPFEHYINNGWKEGRKPNDWFDPLFYLEKYIDVKNANIEPLEHYITQGYLEKRVCIHKNELSKKDYFNYVNQLNNKPSRDFIKFEEKKELNDIIKLIAYYLPQFHPIPENDYAWGKGFTEWTNVSKALPQFENHYQPRLPEELGYYNLTQKETQKRQIEIAKNYGIYGFCYHYYYFDGKKVMNKPIEQILNDKTLDFPFCINWANENWTKRWDGLDNDVILAQNHSEEDDLNFFETIKPLLEDKRYIRVKGKPLLIIYRPKLFPNIKETANRWRQYAKDIGLGEIYLVLTHSFEHIDPNEIGFDAAVEFAPNSFQVKNITKDQRYFNPKFEGTVYDYDSVVEYSLNYEKPNYTKFRSICPSWDNEARKPGKGTVFQNASPEKYGEWLKELISFTKKNMKKEEQFIFINAWNEWAEGAYLEPDRKYGFSYLEKTYNALKDTINKKIIVISHDAYFHGAQYLALNIGKYLKEYFNYDVEFLLQGEGGLIPEFEKIGKTHHLYQKNDNEKIELYNDLKIRGFNKVIANTSVVGNTVKDLKLLDFKIVSLIHEMEKVIKQYDLGNSVNDISKYADNIIFPSEIVKNDFLKFTNLREKNNFIIPQGLFRKNLYKFDKVKARDILLKELNINHDSKIILNIAYGDYRKGIDLFVETGIKLIEKDSNYNFLWVGHFDDNFLEASLKKIKDKNLQNNFHFVGLKQEIDHYYSGSDIFFLSSREDPFPSVVLDAMNVGLPVVAFNDAGGFVDILKNESGILVEKENLEQVSDEIANILQDKNLYELISNNSKDIIENNYSFTKYLFELLILLGENIKKISVVIPNYNYEKYIISRLESIVNQNYPIYEIIYLDDKSRDNSLDLAKEYLQNQQIPFQILANKTNSGSVFKQWAKGINKCLGDYIWIAESDDLCEHNFIENLVEKFNMDKEVILSYSQSKMIDENDNVINENYYSYTDDISTEKWKNDYINDGIDELKTTMVIKNTIPNVSSVIFKKTDITPILEKLCTFKVGGDWYFYIYLLQKGKIAYTSKSLNSHRRHQNSVTVSKENNEKHFNEIIEMQKLIKDLLDVKEEVMLKKITKYNEQTKKILLGDY